MIPPRNVRYGFGPFVLSPRRRTLWQSGREIALIPRYFDLLVLLVQRRDEAVHRSDIFATVWGDVVVSDGALTQAVRALRRALGDDPREPRYIRTVSRHGYRFIWTDVREEADEGGGGVEGDTTHEPLANERLVSPVARDNTPGETFSAHRTDQRTTDASRVDARADFVDVAAALAEQAHGDTAGAPTITAARRDPSQTNDAYADKELEAALDQLLSTANTDEDRRDAAERLHVLGTARALAQLGHRPGAAFARAMLRDSRWDVPSAEVVPLSGPPGLAFTVVALIVIRVRRAWRLAGGRWLSSVLGAAVAGILAGIVGGLGLWLSPGAQAPPSATAVLAVVGALAGAAGACGVGGALSGAETVARSRRGTWLVLGAAVGGFVVGTAAHWLTRWTLEGLFGLSLGSFGGSLEGLLLGAAAGVGYAWATADVDEGMAAPRGKARWHAALKVAACCAVAALLLGAAGRPMVGGLVNAIAQASRSSHFALTPLARAIGEPEFGALTAAVLGAFEGAAFGCGLTLGLTRRPRSRA